MAPLLEESRHTGLGNTEMATIRASCPDCGDVEFTTRDVQVRVSAPDGSGTYAFSCPGCAVTVVKAAETRTIDLLLASGVTMATGETPAEVDERPFFEDPISHDDILDFHDLLHRDDSWFEALAQDNDAS
jgi:predicted RNA-binding Zn-ribbon protein involved in translation (DUF1610 family)